MAISLFEGFTLGFVDFWAHKLKSFITIVGIILGTMSIIVILSIVKGLQERSMQWVNETGGTKMIVLTRNWTDTNVLNQATRFTLRDYDYIQENIPEVEAIGTRIERWGRPISNGPNVTHTTIYAATPAMDIISEWTADQGRFINNLDYREANDVIVIGTTIKNELFGPRNAIGQYITLSDRRLQVIGIMEHKFMDSSNNFNFGNDNPLEYYNRISIIPLSTAINKMGFGDELDSISIRAFSEEQALELGPVLNQLILDIRRGEPVFMVQNGAERGQGDIGTLFKVIFYFVTIISLLVGGIVIMNILLASIKERTREIGIRITVGARQVDIFLQFLVQSIVITLSGGVIGVLVAMAILDYVGSYLKMPTAIDFYTVLLALAISLLVGLFFGIYPAIKASKLDPVKALRVD